MSPRLRLTQALAAFLLRDRTQKLAQRRVHRARVLQRTHVSCAGNDDQPRGRDRRGQRGRVRGRSQHIVLAYQHEGRRDDRRQGGPAIGSVAQARKRGDDGLGRLAHHHRPHPFRQPGIRQARRGQQSRQHVARNRRDAVLAHLCRRGVPVGLRLRGIRLGARVGQDERLHTRPMPPPERQRDVAPHAQAGDDRTLDAQGIEQPGQVIGVLIHGQRAGERGGRAAEPAQVGHDHARLAGQAGQLRIPHPMVEREAVDEQKRGRSSLAAVPIGEPNAIDHCIHDLFPPGFVLQRYSTAGGAGRQSDEGMPENRTKMGQISCPEAGTARPVLALIKYREG